MASLREMNTALELKHPRYSRRIQSKSEPNHWDQESCQGDDNQDLDQPAMAVRKPANAGQPHRRVSAPPTQPGSNIPRRKPKAAHTPVLRDVPSVPDLGNDNQKEPLPDDKNGKVVREHMSTDENRPPVGDGGFRARGGRRGRTFFRGRKGRGLRASPSAAKGGGDKA